MSIKTDIEELNELYATSNELYKTSYEVAKIVDREDTDTASSFLEFYRSVKNEYLTKLTGMVTVYGEKELREKGARMPDWW